MRVGWTVAGVRLEGDQEGIGVPGHSPRAKFAQTCSACCGLPVAAAVSASQQQAPLQRML